MKSQKNDKTEPIHQSCSSGVDSQEQAELKAIREQLTPKIADFNCLQDEDIPAEKTRLESLADIDFQDQALSYLRATIDIDEQRLEELRRTKAFLLEESDPDPNRVLVALQTSATVLIRAVESRSDQGQKVVEILWGLVINERKIDLKKSLSDLDNPIAAAVVALITARVHLGAKITPYINFILQKGNAGVPKVDTSNLTEETARFFQLARIGRSETRSSGTIRCVKYAEWLWANAPELACVDTSAVDGFVRLIAISNSAPFLVREILQGNGILDARGKEIKRRSQRSKS